MADDEFIDKLVVAIQGLKEESASVASNMEKVKKETKGYLSFLSDSKSKWNFIANIHRRDIPDRSLAGKALAQSWLAFRRISAKVSYDLYAIQSAALGGFDTMRAISDFYNVRVAKE